MFEVKISVDDMKRILKSRGAESPMKIVIAAINGYESIMRFRLSVAVMGRGFAWRAQLLLVERGSLKSCMKEFRV